MRTTNAQDRPNIVLILCDNLGYGDIGVHGSTLHRTPHIDRLAADGVRLTNFYVSSGVCTPSRASLMTGCYPRRINMHQSDTGGLVLQPVSPKGLNPDEVTIAEVLQSAGYATALIGKWHLGDQPPFLPTRQGFDSYLGVPYSDDMTPRDGKPWPPLPLLKDETVIESGVERDLLTKRYTEAAVRFIEEHREGPFFLLLSHAMPGSTSHPFASEAFRGKSRNGPWGDSVEEIDWSTGEIVAALDRLEVSGQTLIAWMSDNGAPRRNPPQGSNVPLKGWGYDISEGAMRVPALFRRPGHIPAGTVGEQLCTSMDLLPTFARLAGAPLPPEKIDGRDIGPILTGEPDARSPHEAFYYYFAEQLQAVRSGDWKLYLPLTTGAVRGNRPHSDQAELYNLKVDPAEQRNLAEQEPAIVRRLLDLAATARRELGDGDLPGEGQRPSGMVKVAVPLVPER